MTLVRRAVKNAPLTGPEYDGNLDHFDVKFNVNDVKILASTADPADRFGQIGQVTGTDDFYISSDGATGWVLISPTAAAEAPVNTGAPKVTGSGTIGSPLTVDDGSWDGNPDQFQHQWRRGNTILSTGQSYTPTGSDDGAQIVAEVQASSDGGLTFSPWKASAPITIRYPAPGVPGPLSPSSRRKARTC